MDSWLSSSAAFLEEELSISQAAQSHSLCNVQEDVIQLTVAEVTNREIVMVSRPGAHWEVKMKVQSVQDDIPVEDSAWSPTSRVEVQGFFNTINVKAEPVDHDKLKYVAFNRIYSFFEVTPWFNKHILVVNIFSSQMIDFILNGDVVYITASKPEFYASEAVGGGGRSYH